MTACTNATFFVLVFRGDHEAGRRERPLQVVSVAGTRPEVVKLSPLVREAMRRGFSHCLIASGQQGDLFDEALSAFGLIADRRLGVGWSADRAGIAAALAAEFEQCRPELVLVQGDTDTALIAAQVAAGCGIPVGHVEAGLRSFDFASPFPEEGNRVAIAQLATLHFAPSERAAANLVRERVGGTIYVTGNTGIDALMSQVPSIVREAPAGPVLVTCHRRENFGEPLERICTALRVLADEGVRLIVPLHSNPNSAKPMHAALTGHPMINLVNAQNYVNMLRLIAEAPFVLSDSGGLQEECAALGVPLLLLRENSERPEVIDSGDCVLVGSDQDAIVEYGLQLWRDATMRPRMSVPSFPYGRGDAAQGICDAIERWAGLTISHRNSFGTERLGFAVAAEDRSLTMGVRPPERQSRQASAW